jgi:beta-glucosidase
MMTRHHRLVLAVACLVAWDSATAETVIYAGGAQAPYTIGVGDRDNWGIPVGDEGETATVNGYLTASASAGEGVKTLQWNGKGEAQFFIASPEPQDLTPAVEADAALVMVVNIAEPPRKDVTLRMGCGYPCSANADISRLLKALPENEWVRISVDLKCFVDGGLDATRVDTPLLILTKRKMTMSIADVRIVDGAGPSAVINCR